MNYDYNKSVLGGIFLKINKRAFPALIIPE